MDRRAPVKLQPVAGLAQHAALTAAELERDSTAAQQQHLAIVSREIRKGPGPVDLRQTHAPGEWIARGRPANRLMSDAAAIFPGQRCERGARNDAESVHSVSSWRSKIR